MRQPPHPSPAERAERRALSTHRAHLRHVNTQAIFIAIAALMSAVLAGSVLGPTLTTVWLVLILIVAAALALIGHRARRGAADTQRIRAASELLTALNGVTGLSLGLVGGVLCAAGTLPLKAYALLLVASLLIVAVHTLGSIWRAYLIHSLAASVPLAGCLLAGTSEDRVLGVLLLLVMSAATGSAYHYARMCRRCSRLELEVEELNGVVIALRDRLPRGDG